MLPEGPPSGLLRDLDGEEGKGNVWDGDSVAVVRGGDDGEEEDGIA